MPMARSSIPCTLARPWAKVQRPGRNKSDPGLTARGLRAAPGWPSYFLHLGPSLGQGAAPRPEQVRSGAHGAWLTRRAGLAVLFLAPRPVLGPRCSAPAGTSPIRGSRRVAYAPRRAGRPGQPTCKAAVLLVRMVLAIRPHACNRARPTCRLVLQASLRRAIPLANTH